MSNQLSPPLSGIPEVPFEELVERAMADLPDLPPDPREIMFALDIDGTLVYPQKTDAGQSEDVVMASARVKAALRDVQDLGMTVAVATGRGMASTAPVIYQAGLRDSWTICSNGALTLQWSEEPVVRVRHEFDPRDAAEAVLSVFPDALLAVDGEMEGLRVSEPFPPGELLHQVDLGSIEAIINKPTTKLVVRVPHMTRDDFVEAMAAVPIGDLEVSIGWTSWADVGPVGVTKASALADLADRLEKPRSGIIAIGDGANDISMLSWAGHGVAMGGASKAVMDAANAQTGPVEHDGAAAVMLAIVRAYRA